MYLIDNERVHIQDYVGVGLTQGMQGESDGSIDVTVPIKAGSHMVGATRLKRSSVNSKRKSVLLEARLLSSALSR